MDNLWNSIQSHNRGWILGVSLWVGLGAGLTGCASLQHTLSTSGAAALGGGLCAAAGVEPILTAGCAAAAVAGTEVLVPAKEPLSDNPEIAKAQLKNETIMDFLHWIIGGGILLTVIAWLIPGPQITMPWRRKKDEVRIQQQYRDDDHHGYNPPGRGLPVHRE